MTSVLYFEKQSANLCGQHCLNNLMQGPRFSLDTLMTVARQLDQEEKKLLSDDSEFVSTNVDESGNFSLQVLRVGLNAYDISLVDSQHASVASSDIDLSSAVAFVCNLQDHWFAIRKISG
jgi:Ataxin-3